MQDSLNKLSEADARDFMYAVDSGLVNHQGGAFEAACSRAKEYLFWEGPTDVSPRRLTLWMKPVITIAGLWRMYHEHGWPAERLARSPLPTLLTSLGTGLIKRRTSSRVRPNRPVNP